MGKFDTVLTLGIIGAVAVAGYAVYRNLGKVGGVVSTSIEKSVTDPFGNWLDSLSKGLTTNGDSGAPAPLDPSAPAFGFLPEAQAPLSTDATYAITTSEAQKLEDRYLPRAKQSAIDILKSFNPYSQDILVSQAQQLAEKSPTPNLTLAQSIVDQARVSVGGADPLTNKFFQLFTLANKPLFGGKILPLSKEAVLSYASKGIVAREKYL